MCDPVSMGVLMAASTAASAMGQYAQGQTASANARMAEAAAVSNRNRANEQAVDAIARGQRDQEVLGRDIAKTRGQQIARAAANGIDVGYGSAANMIGDTAQLGAEDSQAVADNAFREMRGFEINAVNFEAERRSQVYNRKAGKVATVIGIGSTILGGATQYAKYKAGT